MNKDAIISKIKKLLSLANSDNENEAKLAAERAQELLVKYNLDIQTIQANKEYIEAAIAHEPYMRWHQPHILQIVQRFFFVKAILQHKAAGWTIDGRRKYQKIINLLGTHANVEVATFVFLFLSETYQKLWLDYKRKNALDERYRKSYYAGLTSGLAKKLETARHRVEKQYGLMVIPDPGLEEKLKGLTSHKTSDNYLRDYEVMKDGQIHGRNIEIAKPLSEKSEINGLMLPKGEQ